jgi:hypothetical protein
MERPLRGERIWDCLWFLGWAIASSAWCVTGAAKLGATFDEPVYVVRGLEHWRTGSHSGLLRLGTMPLPVDVDTLPLYLWERWHGTQIDPARDWEEVIPWARAGTLVFWWLLLGYGWKAGRLLAGPWGGRLAVAMLACEPSLLAHAGLATTDMAVSACVLAMAYHFRAGRDAGWLRRIGLPALWFGAAVLAKASGMVFGVVCLLVMELERLLCAGAFSNPPATGLKSYLGHILNRLKPSGRDLAFIVAGGFTIVFLYCGSDWRAEPSFVRWARSLPEGPAGQVMVWTAEHLRIFSNAGEAIVRQIKHNVHGHGAYLLGHTDPRALWYYFPVLLTIKLSLSLLVAVVLLTLLQPRTLMNWALLAAGALVMLSVTWHVQIGIRIVLPLVALGIVGIAAALVQACQTTGPAWQKGLFMTAAGTGVIWTTAAAMAVWPGGLSYVNELWGGTRTGYLRVSDANYDWGQGLKELTAWKQEHGITDLDVWYFGTDPTLKRLPLRETPFHTLPIHNSQEVLSIVRGHYLAVSTTLLYGASPETPSGRLANAFLHTQQPVARTSTFLIYNFTEGSAAVTSNLPATASAHAQNRMIVGPVATSASRGELAKPAATSSMPNPNTP